MLAAQPQYLLLKVGNVNNDQLTLFKRRFRQYKEIYSINKTII